PRSDLFSLGCVLYRLCTGQAPFGREDTLATLSALALEEPPQVKELNPAVPPELSKLIGRLLTKDPAGRPASAGKVVEALREIEQAILAAMTIVPSSAVAGRPPVRRTVGTGDMASRGMGEVARQRQWWIVAAEVVAGIL